MINFRKIFKNVNKKLFLYQLSIGLTFKLNLKLINVGVTVVV